MIVLVAVVVLLLDILSKSWVQAVSEVEPTRLPYLVIENFCGISMQITHASNTGAAWGVFADFPGLLVLFRLALISTLVVYLVCYNKRAEWRLPLVLIISGALGNVIDFFIYGYVVDMIQMNFWGYDYPIFNIADSAIFTGALWLFLSSFFEKNATDPT